MLEIIKPCKQYLESYYEACIETKGHIHDDYIMHDPDKYDEWKDTIFEKYENNERGIDLPEGFQPAVTRWFVEDGMYVGTLKVRKRVDDVLMNWGGTIGIIIRYGLRGHGYSIRASEVYRKQNDLYEYVEDDFIVYTIKKDNELSLKNYRENHYTHVEEACYITKVKGEDTEVYRFIVDKDEVFNERNA